MPALHTSAQPFHCGKRSINNLQRSASHAMHDPASIGSPGMLNTAVKKDSGMSTAQNPVSCFQLCVLPCSFSRSCCGRDSGLPGTDCRSGVIVLSEVARRIEIHISCKGRNRNLSAEGY